VDTSVRPQKWSIKREKDKHLSRNGDKGALNQFAGLNLSWRSNIQRSSGRMDGTSWGGRHDELSERGVKPGVQTSSKRGGEKGKRLGVTHEEQY